MTRTEFIEQVRRTIEYSTNRLAKIQSSSTDPYDALMWESEILFNGAYVAVMEPILRQLKNTDLTLDQIKSYMVEQIVFAAKSASKERSLLVIREEAEDAVRASQYRAINRRVTEDTCQEEK